MYITANPFDALANTIVPAIVLFSIITAFATGSVMVVLPMLIEEIKALLKNHSLADEETDAAVDVLIPTTFNFPSVAMLLVLSFIPFAGWYAGNTLSAEQYPQFASVGLFVAFGGCASRRSRSAWATITKRPQYSGFHPVWSASKTRDG